MSQRTLVDLSDEELADIWCSLIDSATRRGEPFKQLSGVILHELLERRGPDALKWVGERCLQYTDRE